MVSITEFLRARIIEDEMQAAKHYVAASSNGLGDYPSRILAECAAKRHAIALHEAFGKSAEPEARPMWHATGATLKILANVYRGHNDFNPEWEWK